MEYEAVYIQVTCVRALVVQTGAKRSVGKACNSNKLARISDRMIASRIRCQRSDAAPRNARLPVTSVTDLVTRCNHRLVSKSLRSTSKNGQVVSNRLTTRRRPAPASASASSNFEFQQAVRQRKHRHDTDARSACFASQVCLQVRTVCTPSRPSFAQNKSYDKCERHQRA